MSRRRTSRTPDVVHGYWPHSDPEPPPVQATTAATPPTDDDQPCPGPCNTAFRAAENAALNETAAARDERRPTNRTVTDHDVPFHPGKPTWCVDVPAFNAKGEMLPKLAHHGCTQTILDRLRNVPDLATWLAPGKLNTPRNADIDRSSSKSGGARALSHAPSPSPGWDTADEVIRWAVDLEDWLRDLTGDTPNGSTFRSLTEAVAYIGRRGTAMLASVDAERIGHDVMSIDRRLEHLVGQDRLVHRLAEPCPRCNRKGLRRKDGDELVRCGSCRAVWAWDQFHFLARTYAETVKATGA